MLLVLAVAVVKAPKGKPYEFLPEPPKPTYRQFDQKLLWYHIQEYKREQGLQPYMTDQTLCEIAESRLPDIKTNFNHDGMSAKAQILYQNSNFNGMGENLARFDYTDTEPNESLQLKMWLNSPKHRENLDNPFFTHSCLRCDQNYCVHLFAGY